MATRTKKISDKALDKATGTVLAKISEKGLSAATAFGHEAVKHWNSEEKERGMADRYGAMALAVYMQEAANGAITCIPYAKKTDAKGNKIAQPAFDVSLLNIDAERERLSKSQSALQAINVAIAGVIFGLKDMDMRTSAAFKTRLGRIMPAALRVVERANVAGVKIADSVKVGTNGLEMPRALLPSNVDASSVITVSAPNVKKPAPTDTVAVSVASLAKKPVEPRQPNAGNGNSNTPATPAAPVMGRDNMTANFVSNCAGLRGRLRSIVRQQPGSAMNEQEQIAWTTFVAALDEYQQYCTNREMGGDLMDFYRRHQISDHAPVAETPKVETAAPTKPARKTKVA